MKTDMIISCPNCQVENTVTMEYQEDNRLNSLYAMIMPDVKQYTFYGETKCTCGETINVELTVGVGDKRLKF